MIDVRNFRFQTADVLFDNASAYWHLINRRSLGGIVRGSGGQVSTTILLVCLLILPLRID
jgi:hypothetical protein